MIGIGVGNNAYEVDIFRKNYGIAFPLFPDPSMAVSKKLGAVRTPTFIAVAFDSGGVIKQFLFNAGPFGEPDRFLEEVIKQSAVFPASGG